MPTTDPLRRDLEQLAHAGDQVQPADPAFIRERGQARRNKRRAVTGASIAAVFIAGAAVGSFFLPDNNAPLPAAGPSTAVSGSPTNAQNPKPSPDATSSPASPTETPTPETTTPAQDSPAATAKLSADNLASASELSQVSVPLAAAGDIFEGWPGQSSPSICLSNADQLSPTAAFTRDYGTKPGEPMVTGVVLQFASEDEAKQAMRTINGFYDTCEATVTNNGHKQLRSTLAADLSLIDQQLQAEFGSAEASSRMAGYQSEENAEAFQVEHAELVRVGDRIGWYLLTGVSVSEDLSPNYGTDAASRTASWSLPYQALARALVR